MQSANATQKRIPVATCRLQFNRDFTLSDALNVLDYLRDLGISDCYASPLFEARPDSTHGYDVCCFTRLNPCIGTETDFGNFTRRSSELGMGLLLDFVPNHMSASPANAWWLDVLEHGPDSRYAGFFDINWRPSQPELHNKVLMPILEDDFERVLESGKLRIEWSEGRFRLRYHDHALPLARDTIPAEWHSDPRRAARQLNGRPGDAHSFKALRELLDRQHYRLACWRLAHAEINYRRFFDITELAALRMEEAEVFAAVHELLFQWIAQRRVSGVRVDHPDGLRDPKQYFEGLHQHAPSRAALYVVAEKILSPNERLPDDWPVDGTTGYDFLNQANGLFVHAGNAPALDRIYREFTRANGQVKTDFGRLAIACKRQILETSLVSDVNGLARRLEEIASRTGASSVPVDQLKFALIEVIAAFPVYRTYIDERHSRPSEQDRRIIEKALSSAREAGSPCDPAALDLLRALLLLEMPPDLPETATPEIREFVARFQQLTGPAAAKGIEDTAFYRFHRLLSLNEVGGDPGVFGISVREFHDYNTRMAERWPHSLLATATHDTKRGEDARARLNVISEMPEEWERAVNRWRKWNVPYKTRVNGLPTPSANDEYMLYQSLLGAFPPDVEQAGALAQFRDRALAFVTKAVREAKLYTSWTDPNEAFETAVREFVVRLLDPHRGDMFFCDFRTFADELTFFGRFNSLSQTLLKLTCPGVPDLYQGCELWDLSFVDPDNRRPVDFHERRRLLEDLKKRFDSALTNPRSFLDELLQNAVSGQIKMHVIWRALDLRHRRRAVFDTGPYSPLEVSGEKAQHVCAFLRGDALSGTITLVPRLVRSLTRGQRIAPIDELWGDTVLVLPAVKAKARFRNVFTNEIIQLEERGGRPALPLASALRLFPVALMEPV